MYTNLLKYFSREDLNQILSVNNLYLKAVLVVEELFKNKVDKSGKPYVGHLYRVADRLNSVFVRIRSWSLSVCQAVPF